jgi:subtilisin family serine protease
MTNSKSDVQSPSFRQLVLIAENEAEFRSAMPLMEGPLLPNSSALMGVLREHQALLFPLFRTQQEYAAVTSGVRDRIDGLADVSSFFSVDAPDEDLDMLEKKLRDVPGVEAAYVMPAPELPVILPRELSVKPMPREWTRSKTMNYRSQQGYLDPAPNGVDAAFAWSRAGGRGASVRIIDIEGDWLLTHENLIGDHAGVLGGTPTGEPNDRNHGTAVLSILRADDGGFGVTGIAPEASVNLVSWASNTQGWGPTAAIRAAASLLSAGDILVLEMHFPGPRYGFAALNDQRGYIPVEWWPDPYQAIKEATDRGILVVSAAGNGADDLTDPIYDVPQDKGWKGWENPFRRRKLDSGSILVGAGAPPTEAYGPDRSRLSFSNYGPCIDCQGWGKQVVAAGYGNLQGGPVEQRWYMDDFGGTSSATPIVAGTLACLQGAMKARDKDKLVSPTRARELLRTTGSKQQDGPGLPATQRIGSRPDLRQLIAAEGL